MRKIAYGSHQLTRSIRKSEPPRHNEPDPNARKIQLTRLRVGRSNAHHEEHGQDRRRSASVAARLCKYPLLSRLAQNSHQMTTAQYLAALKRLNLSPHGIKTREALGLKARELARLAS